MFRAVKTPLFLLVLVLVLDLFGYVGILPSSAELSTSLKFLFSQYGFVAVAILTFFENLAVLNFYFPGSVIILTAMTLTAGDPPRAILTYITYLFSALIAQHINFFWGLLLKGKNQPITISSLPRFTEKTTLWLRFLILFSHPQLASLCSIQTGSEGHKYRKILPYLFISTFIWSTFWGLTMYFIGLWNSASIDFKYLTYLYVIAWLSINALKYARTQGYISRP